MLEHTLTEQVAALRRRNYSARDLTDAYLARIGAQNAALNAYVTVTAESARAAADAADAALAVGNAPPLAGIPIAHKDIFCTDGVRTSCASRMLDNFVAPYDATVVERLAAAGVVMLGKTNMDEFAMGSSNETSFYGPVRNPWDVTRVPGGSSGGSAAAVAAGLCSGATGTDTGGSIRQPAALTGICGLKPTYGRVSRYGMIAFASSLDQAGPMARTVRDCAILLREMASHDPKDSTSVDIPVPDYEAALGRSVKGLKVGVPREYRIDGMPGEIEKLWADGVRWMKDAGCEIVDISLPLTKYALPVYYIVAPAEASSNLARYDGVRYGHRAKEFSDVQSMYSNSRAEGFGKEVQRRIMIGTYVLSAGYYDAYYIRAQKVRKRIFDEFTDAFGKCDLILTPSAPSAAFALGEKSNDPVQMYLNDVFTVTANLAGLPGASVPAGLDAKGLPLGLQLIARPFDEETMFKGMSALEQAAAFNARPVAWWA